MELTIEQLSELRTALALLNQEVDALQEQNKDLEQRMRTLEQKAQSLASFPRYQERADTEAKIIERHEARLSSAEARMGAQDTFNRAVIGGLITSVAGAIFVYFIFVPKPSTKTQHETPHLAQARQNSQGCLQQPFWLNRLAGYDRLSGCRQ